MAEAAPRDVSLDDTNIVLVGKVGCGKSASGNTILSKEKFRSSFGFSAVTKTCDVGFAHVRKRFICVVDTPGLDYTELSRDELLLSIDIDAPIVNVFLLVIQLGRFTEEQRAAVQKMEDFFSERSRDFTIILFTHGDSLEGNIKDFIDNAGSPLQQVIRKYGDRYHVFNNESGDPSQVAELFKKIDTMRTLNQCRFYTFEDPVCHLRVALVGKVGSGKSATGNTILGREEFMSSFGFSAVTKSCEIGITYDYGRSIYVTDTPGLDYTEVSTNELITQMDLETDIIHVFLLVIQLGRFTEEQRAAVQKMEDIFGERARDFTIILFTHGDSLKSTIKEVIRQADEPLQEVVKKYGDRYHVFNNVSGDPSQVTELLKKIDRMRDLNQHRCYVVRDARQEARATARLTIARATAIPTIARATAIPTIARATAIPTIARATAIPTIARATAIPTIAAEAKKEGICCIQ